MGDYKNSIQQHDFSSRVGKIRSLLGSLPTQATIAVEDVDPGVIERLGQLLDDVLVLSATVRPEVVPTAVPGQLASALDDVFAQLNNLTDPTTAAAHAPDVTPSVEALTSQLWTWRGAVTGDDWREGVTDAAATFRRSAGQHLASLTSEIDEVRRQLDDIRASMVDLQEKATNHASELDSRLADVDSKSEDQLAALTAKIDALQTQVTATIEQQNTAIRQYQEQFSGAQEKRTSDFGDLVQQAKDELAELRNDWTASGQQGIAKIQEQIEQAKELVSVFAGAGTANAFGKEARQQGDQADRWRWIAVGVGVLGAIAAAILILAFGNKAGAAEISGKVAITIVLAGIAGYAGNQSAEHRRREVANRRAELLMSSFEPFSRDLPEDERNKARKDLLDTLLSDSTVAHSKDDPSQGLTFSSSQLNLIQQLFELARK